MKHSLRMSGWVVGAVLVLLMAAACMGTSVFELEVGDCIKDPHSTEEFKEISTVERVDCSEPHYGQVLALFELEESEFPGLEALDSTAWERCPSGTTDIFVPSEKSWREADDREIICIGE